MAEAVAAKAGAGIAVEVYKDGRQFFGKKIDYAENFEINYGKLTEQAAMVYARREDVQTEINKNKMSKATNECEAWISRVVGAEQQVLKLKSKYEKEIKHAWRFPWFWSRANLSKRMAQKCEELKALLEEGKLPNGVVAERPPELVRVIDAPRTEDKPSLHWAVEEILGLLRERKVKRIGLWGTMGTGKTTAMQNLNNNEEVGRKFDIVIWVSVSKAWSVEKMQHAIMERLKLKVEGGVQTSQLISNELRGKRYLLLLDEVWNSFNLSEIGIYDNDKDSKVVFASRKRNLCHDMGADELVQMKPLSDAEAYKMFEEKVGRIMNDPDIRSIARKVVKECARLPLLIDKVARTFRNKDNIRLWRLGLESLQKWTRTSTRIPIEGMDEVLEFLKFCYEDLDGEDKKLCFLYGALFPEDREIFVDYLMECWKAEGFLHGIDELQGARDKGYYILDNLINVSLLEKTATKKHVRMNKVLRDMALVISSKDHKFLARTCTELKEAPNEEEWVSASRISLVDNDLYNLPATPNCTNLSTLLLQGNKNLRIIPDRFFLSMQRLRVLDLHRTAITFLPPSLSYLTDLRALYLNSCPHLTELPSSLGALVLLEVLDIRRTGIISLPIEVRCLEKLRCLRMSFSSFGSENPIMISSLSLLEELIIDVDPNTQWSDQVVRTVTQEVSTLTRLTSLTFSFHKVEFLDIFIKSSCLWKDERFTFQFSVGICNSIKHTLDYFEHQLCKWLKYANHQGVHSVISEVLAETYVFELIDHKNIRSLSDFGTENMSKLRACSVEGCEDIMCIIDGDLAPPPTFEWLERMVIKNVPGLHCIWKGPVPVGSLGRMTSLTLNNCPVLKKIFSNGLIKQLSELQNLNVEDCCEIEEIIIESEDPCLGPGTLPCLKKLILRDLPQLRSIAPDGKLMWPSLESVEIGSCPSLLKLPFTKENAINLRSMYGEKSWWSTLVWQDHADEQRLLSLCNLA